MDVEEGKLERSKGWNEEGQPVAGEEMLKTAAPASLKRSKKLKNRQTGGNPLQSPAKTE